VVVFLNATIIDDYKKGFYENICNLNNIQKYIKNEKILSLVGISCVRSDRLFLLPLIYRNLKKTKKARINSIYFQTIYMQKRLLYSYFFDNLDLKNFDLPLTDYILSIVFDKIKNKKFKKENGIYIIKLSDKTLKLYKEEDKLILETFKKNKLIKRRWFR
jgi:hypothetical protein